MAENNFKANIEALIGGMEGYLNTKTVVGEAINIGENILLPLADVSFGVGAGAFEGKTNNTGGGGMGAKISPAAVLVVNENGARILNINDNPGLVERVLEMAPGIISKVTNKGNSNNNTDTTSGEEIFE